MGRGFFSGRSTPSQQNQLISTPTLIATDAQPRDDLHLLGQESSFDDFGQPKPKSRIENERPKTAGSGSTSGRARSKSRADPRVARPPPPAIDERISPSPPPGGMPTYLDTSDEMIGMALGSPRGDPNWESPSQASGPAEVPSLPMTTILAGPDERGGDKPKSQKWKKLGGLFGGRRQQESRGDSQPRSFWDVYAQHAQSQPTKDAVQAPKPEPHINVRAAALMSPDRPANPPPYSFAPPVRGDSLPVPELQVRSTPSPIEEVEHEINKMIAHNSWDTDDSPSISPVDEVDEIPLDPLSPYTSTADMGRGISPLEEEVRPYSPKPTNRADVDSESIVFHLEPSSPQETTSFFDNQLDFGQSSLLDIEIPSIQMERYSVMFGSFLSTDTSDKSEKSDKADTSSILARRQVDKHLERLKTIPDPVERVREDEPEPEPEQKPILTRRQTDKRPGGLKPLPDVEEETAESPVEERRGRDILPLPHTSNAESSRSVSQRDGKVLLEVRPQRRATSPTPVRSPSFSLFPAAAQKPMKIHSSSSHYSSAKASGLQRSHTAPGAISPNRTTFEPTPVKTRVVPQHLNHERFLFKVQSPAQTASTSSSSNPAKWSSDGSMLSMSSQSSDDEDDEGEDLILDTKPLKPLVEQEEPAWEMIGPAPAGPEHQRDDISQPAASNGHKGTPQISVARSVSTRPQELITRRGTKVERDRLEVDERLIEHQPHTPTLVEPHRGGHGHRPKKSQNIVIESI